MSVLPSPAPAASTRRRGLLPGAGLFFVLSLLLAGCTSPDARRWIVTANDLQDTAARAYEKAKADELAAGTRCRQAAEAAGKLLPSTAGDQVVPFCLALGAPLPYDPIALRDLATPINAAYDAVRAADAVRRGVTAGDPITAAQAAVGAVWYALKAAASIGLDVPLAGAEALKLETTR